ncbi:hypothetical protein [Sphingobacterium bambusae]|uniref:DUF3945 domain-containing protein n=1 Tax=Sphingobacterium bambusae TaxID=662858 RepID=A0ABW6BJ44_9SPHI|nr:hypothetical protein [Sphingobacterium bambusae]WPL49371.1 hypothetical protein SCB77_02755 [Sphingobacterium bambusae]
MNENNLEYLKKTLDNLGFDNKLNEVLETAIRREMPNFSLGIQTTHRPLDSVDPKAARTEKLSFDINFNRSKDSDMYFLNDYKVTLQQKDNPIVRSQTFNLERDYRVTALQAFKLLSGQAIEKDVFLRTKNEPNRENTPNQERTPVWFKLNLEVKDAYGNHPMRTFRPEYGYDLEASLKKYPIKGLKDAEKLQEVSKALRNGNIVQADLQIGRRTIPVTLAANPQMKTIDILDKDRREVRDEAIFASKDKTQSVKVPRSADLAGGREASEPTIEANKQDVEQTPSAKRSR